MELKDFIKKYDVLLILLAVIGIALYSSGGFAHLSQNCGGFSMNRQGETSIKLPSILYSPSADCKDYIYSHKWIEDDYPPAYCEAKIYLSDIYGRDCTKNPYIDYAKINVKCEGDRLYIYEGEPDDTWDDIRPRIKCGQGYCTGYDRSFPAGEHEITLQNTPGKMKSYFFVCYDYDYRSGWWCYSWAGYGFWGDREVVESECFKGDEKCEGFDYYVCSNYKWEKKGKIIGKCGVECLRDTDCGGTVVSDNYCYKGDVYRDVTRNLCQNYKCIQQTERELVEKCKYGCENGKCIEIGFTGMWYIIGGAIAFLIIILSIIYYKL